MLIGYARVSTEDQNLDLQVSALERAGAERIFTDKLSGTRTDRPGLQEALSHLRAGDSLLVWKLDRLGRGVKGLVELVGGSRKAWGGLPEPDGFHRHVHPGGTVLLPRHGLAGTDGTGTHPGTHECWACRSQGSGEDRGDAPRRLTNGKLEAAKKLLAGGTPPKDVATSLGGLGSDPLSLASCFRALN